MRRRILIIAAIALSAMILVWNNGGSFWRGVAFGLEAAALCVLLAVGFWVLGRRTHPNP